MIATDTNARPHFLQDGMTDDQRSKTLELHGAHYYDPGTKAVVRSKPDQLYSFVSYVGDAEIELDAGDSCWYLSDDLDEVWVVSGPKRPLHSSHWATVIRGYACPRRSSQLSGLTCLPYVNGCSTKQPLSPMRPGDPTMQFLRIPGYSAEQAHHIHSTVRVVYVLRGRGVSVVGMEGQAARTELLPGMVVYLEPMSPHHFETPQGENLEVVPLHVWSSTPQEQLHPMFTGTHLTDQGK